MGALPLEGTNEVNDEWKSGWSSLTGQYRTDYIVLNFPVTPARQISFENDNAADKTRSTMKQAQNEEGARDGSQKDNSILIPLFQRSRRLNRSWNRDRASEMTPLSPTRQQSINPAKLVLFGDAPSLASVTPSKSLQNEKAPTGVAGFFFGFMYEEPSDDEEDEHGDDEFSSSQSSVWNPLTTALFVSYLLTSAATTVPVVVIPTMSSDLFLGSDSSSFLSTFASSATASAVMGSAFGKFINGPVGDLFGARRTMVAYACLQCVFLWTLALSHGADSASRACFFIEFCQSVQWPCILVLLATHFQRKESMFEGGIYITSIASRLGSFIGIPLFSFLLHHMHWRTLSFIGAWMSLVGASVAFLFLQDSPSRVNEPQNALDPAMAYRVRQSQTGIEFCQSLWLLMRSIFSTMLAPSFHNVLRSGIFWIVALAHIGSSVVRSSERMLGSYYHDTSFGTLSEHQAGSLAVSLSFGSILGLIFAGNTFAHAQPRQRKVLVTRLYALTIGSCYVLAALAFPQWKRVVQLAPLTILTLQMLASLCMGFGISVMSYHIPGLVGATFGSNKGMFSAYTDGVANGFSSVIWRAVGRLIETDHARQNGWVYGWAAIALVVLMCAVLMVEFMEHFFIRNGYQHKNFSPSKRKPKIVTL